jgi:rhodanese-related sulfurtransferase
MFRNTTLFKVLAVLTVFSMIVLAGCADDAAEETTTTEATTSTTEATTTTTEATTTTVEETTTTTAVMVDELTVLAEHLTSQFAEWSPVIGADALYENLTDGDDSNDPFIVSVRSAEHYALGHIEGAINIPWKNIADPGNLAQLPTDQPIVVYCYTGHTGQVAATLLKSFGYDVQNLKFGMMGWSDDPDVVATTPFSAAPGYPTVTEATVATETYDLPVLNTGETEATEIAIAAAQAMLADWTPVTAAATLFDNIADGDDSNDYFVVSVRSADDYALGHVEGAINIGWKAIADPANLASMPTDQPVMVYCYTGHTGQVAATALALLGYDAINMKFGMMGWSDDPDVVATTPFSSAPGYPTVTG